MRADFYGRGRIPVGRDASEQTPEEFNPITNPNEAIASRGDIMLKKGSKILVGDKLMLIEMP